MSVCVEYISLLRVLLLLDGNGNWNMTTHTFLINELRKNSSIFFMVVKCGLAEGHPDMVKHIEGF
jgi:hypothetical protein